jgi:hypothetical protein
MAEIQLEAGTLPPYPACYSSEQERFDAYVSSIIATIIGGIQWEASETAPTDLTMWWQKIDSNGRIVEYLKWSATDGAWIRPFSEVINTGTAAGAGNAYTITNSPAMTAATAYRAGATFTFKANHINTGAATLNVDSLGAQPLKKFGGTSDVAAGDIASGQMVTAVYDGTNFQIISALTATGTAGSQFYGSGSGNFVVPTGVYSLEVELVGGGGGGGFSGSALGGGGGGYCYKRWSVTPGQIIPYAVGVGGTRGTVHATPNSTDGGDTTFNTSQIAEGGIRGDSTGVGGTYSGADYGFNGEGGFTTTAKDAPGKYKGGKPGCGWGYGGAWYDSTAIDGYVGGGGCGDTDAGGGAASSAGGTGAIIIRWYHA